MSEAIIDIKTRAEHTEHKSSARLDVLRVLNGKQQGAQIPLEARRYRIGSSEDCDIVLIGNGVAAQHLDFFFADNLMTITHVHAPTFLHNEPIAVPLEVISQEIIQLGKTAISFGAKQDEWPQPETIVEAITKTEVEPKQAFSFFALFAQWGLDKPKNIIRLAFSSTLAISTFVILLAVGLHYFEKPSSIPNSAADRLAKQISSDPAYTHIHLIPTKPKKQLVGYVKRTQDLNRLRYLAIGSYTNINVVSLNQLEKSLNIISEIYGEHLSYRLTPSGERNLDLLLYGTIQSPNQSEAIQALLKRDLPAITSIRTDIISEHEALDIVNSWLAQYPNFIGLNAKPTKKGIAVQGNLLGNFRENWEAAIKNHPPRLPQNIAPISDVYFSPMFTEQILSVLTGKQAKLRIAYKKSSVLASIGDRITGGFIVKKINRNHITLDWQGRQFIYPLPQ